MGLANAGVVSNMIKRALASIPSEAVEEHRKVEGERLNKAWKAISKRAFKGELTAIDSMLRIMDRRAKLLGLDAPSKNQTELTGPDGGPLQIEDNAKDELIARIDRLIAARGSAQDPKPTDGDGSP